MEDERVPSPQFTPCGSTIQLVGQHPPEEDDELDDELEELEDEELEEDDELEELDDDELLLDEEELDELCGAQLQTRCSNISFSSIPPKM